MLTTPQELLAGCEAVVVVSPHLDDAVLSCAALLAACSELGVRTTVVTVFNGLPQPPLSDAARAFHERCGLGDAAMATREVEDDKALERLRADSVRLGMREALYRQDARGRHLYPGAQDIFAEGPVAEPELAGELAADLAELPRLSAADLVLAPLGVGGHVDHKVVADAVRMMGGALRRVLWYEEVPYVLYDHCRGWESEIVPGRPLVCRVSDAQWQTKLDAVDCYRSQHSILWYQPQNRAVELTGYAQSLGAGHPAERYWERS